MDIKKIAASTVFVFIAVVDVITSIMQKINSAIQNKIPIAMFSDINWIEVIVRVALVIAVIKLYNDFYEYKKRQSAKTIDAIRAAQKLSSNSDKVLLTILIEARDRSILSNSAIIKALHELGYNGIKVTDEHPEVTKYKEVANSLLDEQENPLHKIIDNWEINP